MRVGYIGLGAMGGALARHLASKHELTVLDRNPTVVAAFERLGATAASSPIEVARRCAVVLLCLPRSADVREVLFGAKGMVEGLAAGTIVIDQTSGAPRETRDFARLLAERDVSLIDAPVSGAMATAVGGTISIIASGPKAAYEKALPVLKDISPNVFFTGARVGNGQTMKAVNNMMNVGCRLATLEIVAMGRKLGLSLEAMTQAINQTTARNFTSQGMLPAIAAGRQSTKFGLALQLKDVNQAITLGLDQDVAMPVSSTMKGLLQIGLNQLGEGAQLEQMIGVIESMAGTQFKARAPAAQA